MLLEVVLACAALQLKHSANTSQYYSYCQCGYMLVYIQIYKKKFKLFCVYFNSSFKKTTVTFRSKYTDN